MTSDELNKKFGVTDQQLDEWAAEIEGGNLPGEPDGPIVMGRPKLYKNSSAGLVGISFKESPEVVAKLDQKAKASGKTRSEYLRFLIAKDLALA